jgi:hypothetical protein
VALVVTSLDGAVRIAVSLIARPWRGHRITWGATAYEIAASFPGDDLVPQSKWGYTHAVDVAAPPEKVWPWLVQIGQGRGGFYSYQGLENLVGCQIQNTSAILPEFGSLTVGDEVKLHVKAPGLRVEVAEPNKSLVLFGGSDDSPEASLWGFHIVDAGDGHSRLIERGRYSYGTTFGNRLAFSPTFLEPISFVMSRKMLLTIAALAEQPR